MGATALAGLAAVKFMGRTFEDPISLQRVGKSRGVVLNKQMYNARGLKKMVASGYKLVPHTRRRLSPAEVTQIARKSRNGASARAISTILNTKASAVLPPLKTPRSQGWKMLGGQYALEKVSDEVGGDVWAMEFVNVKTGRKQMIFNYYAKGRNEAAERRAHLFLDHNPQVVLDRLNKKGTQARLYFGYDLTGTMSIERAHGMPSGVYVFTHVDYTDDRLFD